MTRHFCCAESDSLGQAPDLEISWDFAKLVIKEGVVEAFLNLVLYVFSAALFTVGVNKAYAEELNLLKIPLNVISVALDPAGVQDSQSLIVVRQIHCQLVRMASREVTLEAAKNIKYLNSTTLLITIKSGLLFSNGDRVEAKDVVATMNYLRDSRKVLTNVFGWIKQISVIDPLSLKIELTQPIPQFLKFLAAPNYSILPEKYIEAAKKDNRLWESPEGCGGYKIDKLNSTDRILKLLPTKSEVPINFYFMGGKVMTERDARNFDLIDSPFSEKISVLEGYRDESTFDPRQIFFALNTQRAPWNKRSNRCSLFSRINIQKILSVYGPIAEKATDFFPRGIVGYANEDAPNPTEIVNSSQGFDRTHFRVSFLNGSVPVELRQAYLQSLEPIFKDVNSEVVESPKNFGLKFLKSGNDAFIFALKSNYIDGYEFLALFSENSVNVTGVQDPKLRSRVKNSQKISDNKARAEVYRQIARELKKECYILPILTLTKRKILVRRDLKTPGLGEVPINEYYLGQVK